ncbi:MAG TPA: putative metallopeptidase [Candidatus Limnocylindrales bacterium]|nr:putative metallopeptidase [Candidatus Limnocylindrales bacterium]
MARRAPRIPKQKPDPIVYDLSDELTSIATALMAKHEVHFSDLRPLRIAYVMVVGGREPKRDRIDGVWARFMVLNPLYKALTGGYDAVVWVRQAIWKVLNEDQRRALIAHQLTHGQTTEKGALIYIKHDVEDFAWVARNFGPWHENVELYGKQLSLFGKPDEKPANGDAFADIDAKVGEEKAEREGGKVTQFRERKTPATDQPQA